MTTPEQHRKLSRRAFIGGAAAAGLAAIVGCKTGESSTPPPSTIKDTIPTTTSIPDTTTSVSSTTPSTEAPTTTVPERVFTSPEQKAQVEAVEGNMEKFFHVTKQEVVAYHETTNFIPYVSGFSMIKKYPAPNDNSYRMLGINLGTIPVQTGNTMSTLEAVGYVTFQGDRFVQLFIQDINDPDLLKLFPTIKTNAGADFWRPIEQDGTLNTYGLDSNHQTSAIVVSDKQIVGAENLINELNNPNQIGAPIIVEYGTDYSGLFGRAGYNYEQNPHLAPTTSEIYQSAKTRSLEEALSKYTSDELAEIGVVVTPSIPSNLFRYDNPKQIIGTLPFGGYVVFLDQAPHII